MPLKRSLAGDFPALEGYPPFTRYFTRLGKAMMPYWHGLYDHCPELLRLDPPEGLTIFRGFFRWAEQQGLPLDWTLYLNLYRWLQRSSFAAYLTEEQLENLMLTAAASWCANDTSSSMGILLGHRRLPGRLVQAWKDQAHMAPQSIDPRAASPQRHPASADFVHCLLSSHEPNEPMTWKPV